MKKACIWGGIAYGLILTAFTVFLLMDTFVITRVYSYAESTTPTPQDVPILTMVDTLHEYDDGNISVTVSLYRGFDSDIYVADVVLSSPTQLRTAFAKDAYGRNIREQPSEIAERLGAILAINGDKNVTLQVEVTEEELRMFKGSNCQSAGNQAEAPHL